MRLIEPIILIIVYIIMKTAYVLSRQVLNERGEWQTVASVVAEMQRDGVSQKLIDRWLQGLQRAR